MLHPPLLIHFHGRKNRVVDRLLGPKPGSPLFSAIDEHLLPSPTPLIPLDLRRGADRCRPQTVTLPSGIVSPKFSFYCLTSRAHGGRLGEGGWGHQVGRIIEGRPPAFLPRVTRVALFPEGRNLLWQGTTPLSTSILLLFDISSNVPTRGVAVLGRWFGGWEWGSEVDAALLVAPILGWDFAAFNVSRNWEARWWTDVRGGSWLIGVKSITFIRIYMYYCTWDGI